MKLKVGDVVEFKKYEKLSFAESLVIPKDKLPKFGKVKEITEPVDDVVYFMIEGSTCIFSTKSVARMIDDVDVDSLKPGDEVLVKVTIGEIRENHIWASWVDKSDVVKILKRKTPEQFIVKEDYYGMYIGVAQTLVSDKSKAKIYTLRGTAIEDASEVLPYDAWEVIPYDD